MDVSGMKSNDILDFFFFLQATDFVSHVKGIGVGWTTLCTFKAKGTFAFRSDDNLF